MNDDDFLKETREPRPEFARQLRARLRTLEDEPARAAFPLARLLTAAAAAAAVVALFAFPSVRAFAQAALDLFRVREFAVVQIDEHRLEQLKKTKLDMSALLGTPEKLHEPGPPQRFASIDAAAGAAGFAPARPSLLPRELALDSVFVQGECRTRVTVDTKPLRDLMDTYDIHDLSIPAGLDGRQVEIHLPKVVVESYRSGEKRRAALVQAESPEVSLPYGVDLPRIGEIGLRLMGVERAEAHRLAGAIDWRSTMVVPVIASATTVQQITVNGDRAVFLESTRTPTPDGGDHGPGAAVLWSHAGRVYALMGNIDRASLVMMAESVR